MTSKTRLANKTLWAFEDIVAACRDGHRWWMKAMEIAERRQDVALTLALARLRDDLGEMERLARDGRQGKYEQIRPEGATSGPVERHPG